MSGDSVVLGQLAEEFSARVRAGEMPAIDQYATAHPELADRIRDLFPTLMVLEGMATGGGADTGGQLQCRLEAGEAFGNYEIRGELGRGGMGVVYQAEHRALNKLVALKILPLVGPQTGASLERFLREARTAATLHHTNIVPVFDVGQAGGLAFYAMQLIEGETLDAKVAKWSAGESVPDREADTVDLTMRQERPPAEPAVAVQSKQTVPCDFASWPEFFQWVAEIGAQAASGLQHAHMHQVIHRDIKPSNLIVDHQPNLWITDFGLARRLDDPSLTHTGMMLGTPRYMSPEQAASATKPIDHRTDIYSLGATLYELIAQRPPFEAGTPVEIVMQILDRQPVALRRLNPQVPRDLETIIEKAMSKGADERYQDAAELAADLTRFADGEPIAARRVSIPERTIRWCKRNPVVAGLSGSVAILLVLVSVLSVVSAIRTHRSAVLTNRLYDNERQARTEAEDARTAAELTLASSLFEQATNERLSRRRGFRKRSLQLIQESNKIQQKLTSSPNLTAEQIAEMVPRSHFRSELLQALRSIDVEPDRSWEGLQHAISHGGSYVCTLQMVGTLEAPDSRFQVTETKSGRTVYSKQQVGMRAMAIDSGGNRLAVSGQNQTWILDLPEAKSKRLLTLPSPIEDESSPSEAGQPKALPPLSQLNFSPDDQWLLAPLRGNRIAVWNVDDDRSYLVTTPWFPGPKQIGFDPEVKHFFVSGDLGILEFELATGRRVAEHVVGKRPRPWGPISLSPDGSSFCFPTYSAHSEAAGGVELIVVDRTTNKIVSTQPMDAGVMYCLKYNPQGTLIAAALADGRNLLFDAKTLEPRARFGPSKAIVRDLVWNLDGSAVFTSAISKGIEEWKVQFDSPVAKLSLSDWAYHSFAIDPSGQWALTATPTSLRQLSWPDLETVREIPIKLANARASFSRHGTKAALIGDYGKKVITCDLKTGEIGHQWNAENDAVASSVGFPALDEVLVCLRDHRNAKTIVSLLDLKTEEQTLLRTLSIRQDLVCSAFDPGGEKLLTVTGNPFAPPPQNNVATIAVDDVESGELVFETTTKMKLGKNVRFSKDGRFVALFRDQLLAMMPKHPLQKNLETEIASILIIDLQSRTTIRSGVEKLIVDGCFSDDNGELAVRQQDGTVLILDFDRLCKTAHSRQPNAVTSLEACILYQWHPANPTTNPLLSPSVTDSGLPLEMKILYSPGDQKLIINDLSAGHLAFDRTVFHARLRELGFDLQD